MPIERRCFLDNLEDFLLTTRQAAATLHVSQVTIQRWVQDGRLSGAHIGHIILVSKDEVGRLARERSSNFE